MKDIDELKENVLALKNEAKEEYEEAVDFYGEYRYETEDVRKKYETLEQIYKLLDKIC